MKEENKMMLILAILGFFAMFIFCALYFPRTAVLISALYFFFKISGLPAAISAMDSQGVLMILAWIILVTLTIVALFFDIDKFQTNPFKK